MTDFYGNDVDCNAVGQFVGDVTGGTYAVGTYGVLAPTPWAIPAAAAVDNVIGGFTTDGGTAICNGIVDTFSGGGDSGSGSDSGSSSE